MIESAQSPGVTRAGWVLSVLAALALAADGLFQLLGGMLAPEALEKMMVSGGFSVAQAPLIGSIVLLSTILYAIPRTAVLGAILLTGYLGGAVCADLRVGGSPAIVVSLILGVLAWGGLYLRDARVRALLPLTS